MYFYSRKVSVQGVMGADPLLSVSGTGDGEDLSLVLF